MLSAVIGSTTSWTWPTPSAAKARSAVARISGSPDSGAAGGLSWLPCGRPSPPGSVTSTATVRSSVAGSRPTFRQAASIWSRSDR